MKLTKLFRCSCGNKFKRLVQQDTIIVKCNKCGKAAVKNFVFDIKTNGGEINE